LATTIAPEFTIAAAVAVPDVVAFEAAETISVSELTDAASAQGSFDKLATQLTDLEAEKTTAETSIATYTQLLADLAKQLEAAQTAAAETAGIEASTTQAEAAKVAAETKVAEIVTAIAQVTADQAQAKATLCTADASTFGDCGTAAADAAAAAEDELQALRDLVEKQTAALADLNAKFEACADLRLYDCTAIDSSIKAMTDSQAEAKANAMKAAPPTPAPTDPDDADQSKDTDKTDEGGGGGGGGMVPIIAGAVAVLAIVGAVVFMKSRGGGGGGGGGSDVEIRQFDNPLYDESPAKGNNNDGYLDVEVAAEGLYDEPVIGAANEPEPEGFGGADE
jgi:hypothetical protein